MFNFSPQSHSSSNLILSCYRFCWFVSGFNWCGYIYFHTWNIGLQCDVRRWLRCMRPGSCPLFLPSASSPVPSILSTCSAVWMRGLLQWSRRDYFISVNAFVWTQWLRKETFCIPPYPFIETLQFNLIFSSKYFFFLTFYHWSLSLTHHIWCQFLSSSALEIVSLPHFLSSNQEVPHFFPTLFF